MNRDELKTIAKETLSILDKGSYNNIKLNINEVISNAELIKDIDLESCKQTDWCKIKPNVINKGVIDTAIELNRQNPNSKITILNFASAKNPGGGFLKGSQAQEESITRATTLYKSLIKFDKEFYQYHIKQNNSLYTNMMIYSPNVQIIRNDNGKLLDKSINIDVISCAAPNAGVSMNRGISNVDIDKSLKDRIYRIIQLAKNLNTDILILGAFGCGVFKNDSERVAYYFERAINQIVPINHMNIKFAIVGRPQKGFY